MGTKIALYKKTGGNCDHDQDYNLVFGGGTTQEHTIQLNDEHLNLLKQIILQALPMTQKDVDKFDRLEALKLVESEA